MKPVMQPSLRIGYPAQNQLTLDEKKPLLSGAVAPLVSEVFRAPEPKCSIVFVKLQKT